jgi:hypothetical protein
VPDGCTADDTERAVTVTTAGESRLEEDFDVVAVPAPSSTPSPSPSGTPTDPGSAPEPSAGPQSSAGDGGPDRGDLAATGATVVSVGLAATILVAVGVGMVRAPRRPPVGSTDPDGER